jgi:hypothetical protein
MLRLLLLLLPLCLGVFEARAQQWCAAPASWRPCDIVFELNAAEQAAHPRPIGTLQLQAEIKSPKFRTVLARAFPDGPGRYIIRFAPQEEGNYEVRLSSNIARFQGVTQTLAVQATEHPGFLAPANMHHWWTIANRQPHLWMGDTCYGFARLPAADFDALVAARARQKFSHLRGFLLGHAEEARQAWPAADAPNHEYFREVDRRLLALNQAGIVVDLVLGAGEGQLTKLFPTWQERERFLQYVVARYAPFDITWQLVQNFEDYDNGKPLLAEMGQLLQRLDVYQHPRSAHARVTSGPLAGDKWMSYLSYQTSDPAIPAIEHEIYPGPQINAEFAYENSGAGARQPHHVDSETFRRRLWAQSMAGTLPTFGNTGTIAAGLPFDAKQLDSPGAKSMTVWREFFAATRFWELEPYYLLDGARALALIGTEYIVWVEKPRIVEVEVEKHGYDVTWFNPRTGERTKKVEWKGERYVGEPPDKQGDWVLHIQREGRKEGMLRSYKFESRPPFQQEIEMNPKFVPFVLEQPEGDEWKVGQPMRYRVKILKQTRATSEMTFLITGEVVADGQGYRVLATGGEGELTIPASMLRRYPATMNLRVAGMNRNGKLYYSDRIVRLNKP